MRSPSVVLLTDSDPRSDRVVIRRVGVRDRCAARLRANRLDRRLAAGVPADSSAVLTLRAQRLLRPITRRRLSKTLHRVVDDVQRGPRTRPLPPLVREQIVAAAPALEQLAERLANGEPIEVRGVAIAQLLVTDPGGRRFHGDGGVAAVADEAFEALAPPHTARPDRWPPPTDTA